MWKWLRNLFQPAPVEPPARARGGPDHGRHGRRERRGHEQIHVPAAAPPPPVPRTEWEIRRDRIVTALIWVITFLLTHGVNVTLIVFYPVVGTIMLAAAILLELIILALIAISKQPAAAIAISSHAVVFLFVDAGVAILALILNLLPFFNNAVGTAVLATLFVYIMRRPL